MRWWSRASRLSRIESRFQCGRLIARIEATAGAELESILLARRSERFVRRRRFAFDPIEYHLERPELLGRGELTMPALIRERLEEMTEFFETGMSAYEVVKQLPPSALRGLLRMKGKLRKLLRPGAA